jgi:hypothetical protein
MNNADLRPERIRAAVVVVSTLANAPAPIGSKTEALYVAAVELLVREFSDGAPPKPPGPADVGSRELPLNKESSDAEEG